MEKNDALNKKAMNGVFWTAVQKFGSMGLSFISNMILARLLTPDDFGLIGIVMVFVYLSNVFIEAGFGSALIQKKYVTKTDYSTVFIWNISIAVVLYTLLFICSPFIADFYAIPRLNSILRVIGLILIINALVTVHTAYLRRFLIFKTIALSFVSATLVALGVSVLMAVKGCGVWCLVGFQLTQGALNAIFIWFFSDLRFRLIFSKNSFKPLFNYGAFVLLSSLITTARSQGQNLFIGKISSPENLGYFTQAKLLESAPTNTIYSVICQVALPFLSRFQDDDEKIRSVLYKLNQGISLIIIPLIVLLILTAKPLVEILLSSKWLPAAPCFQILCIGSIARPLNDINIFAIAAKGNSRMIFYLSILFFTILVIAILLGSFYGFYGVVFGVALSDLISLFLSICALYKVVGYSVVAQIKAYKSPILLTIASLIPALLCRWFLPDSYWYDTVTGGIFLLCYILIGFITKTINFREILKLLHRRKLGQEDAELEKASSEFLL